MKPLGCLLRTAVQAKFRMTSKATTRSAPLYKPPCRRKHPMDSVCSGTAICAIDVGLRHMALCMARFPIGAQLWQKEKTLREAKDMMMRTSDVLAWEVQSIVPANSRSNFVSEIEAVSEYVRQRKDLFTQAQYVVIEHQMASKMRALSAALIAAIKAHVPTAAVHLQQSSMKLSWADLASVLPDAELQTYKGRKAASVAAARYALDLPTRKPKGTEIASPRSHPAAQALLSSQKQDDLADALLHMVMFAQRCAPPLKNSRKRTREERRQSD